MDEGEEVGGDGTLAVVVFIIGGAACVADECVLDGVGGVCGHVIVEVGLHADGHGDGLVVAEQVALAAIGILVARVDTGYGACGGVDVFAHLPAEALLVAGALIIEATEIPR